MNIIPFLKSLQTSLCKGRLNVLCFYVVVFLYVIPFFTDICYYYLVCSENWHNKSFAKRFWGVVLSCKGVEMTKNSAIVATFWLKNVTLQYETLQNYVSRGKITT